MADPRDVAQLSAALGINGDQQMLERLLGAADPNTPAAFVRDRMARIAAMQNDPARAIDGMAPNFGQTVLPHVLTFQGLFGTFSKVYRASDEALKNSLESARFMRNNPLIMECIEARQRATALLEWHLEPEDTDNEDHKELCNEVEKIIRRIRRFTEYRFNLLHAIWYGRYGIQHAWGWQEVAGKMRIVPRPVGQENPGWLPIHGDKLVFRFDDGTFDEKRVPNQVGIRVGARFGALDRLLTERWAERIEPTDRGPAYFLTDYEREMIAIHKHTIEDGAYEDGIDAGTIHGVGIRSRIYWVWFQMQETLAFLMEYLERSALGLELWRYPAGNAQALAQMKQAAEERIANQHNMVFIPTFVGDLADSMGVEHVELGVSGVAELKEIIQFFAHQIKRLILGQVLSSEAEATGLGSGVAELHLDTLLQIVKYDATNLEETITHELVKRIKDWNFPHAKDIQIHFKINTESPDVEKKLEGWARIWEMGAKLKTQEVMDLVGASIPNEDDEVLQNPAFRAQEGDPTHPDGTPNNKSFSFPDRPSMEAELAENLGVEQTPPGKEEPGSKVTVAENGKFKQKQIPYGDTGDRHKVKEKVAKLSRLGFRAVRGRKR